MGNIIEDISRKGKKYELRNVESVGITQSELNRIKSAKQKIIKKYYLQCYALQNYIISHHLIIITGLMQI